MPKETSSRPLDALQVAWRPTTKGLMIASPANPTGTLIDSIDAGRIVRRRW
jgi:aspartate/methionine/tyrosine aminotransferase